MTKYITRDGRVFNDFFTAWENALKTLQGDGNE